MFTDKTIGAAERSMRQIGYDLSRQSDRSLPRTYFRSGYIPNKSRNSKSKLRSSLKRCGQEIPGIILVLIVFLLQEDDPAQKQVRERIGKDRIHNYIKLLEYLLLFESWLKQKEIPRHEVVLVETTFVSPFMAYYKIVVARTDGDGLCVRKFHFNVHLCPDIFRYGVPSNYTGHFGESNLKFNGKNWARLTQRRNHTLDNQTGNRNVESAAVFLAAAEVGFLETGRWKPFYGKEMSPNLGNRMGCRISLSYKRVKSDLPDCSGDRSDSSTSASTTEIKIQFRTTSRNAGHLNTSERVEHLWSSTELSFKAFSTFVHEDLYTGLNEPASSNIEFFTETTVDGVKYRANPMQMKHAWSDFAYAKTDIHTSEIPINILLFVRLKGGVSMEPNGGVSMEPFGGDKLKCLTDGGSVSDGDYALVHYFLDSPRSTGHGRASIYGNKDRNYALEGCCRIVRWGCKVTPTIGEPFLPAKRAWKTRAVPCLALVSLKAISGPCVSIKDRNSSYPHCWNFLAPRTVWPKLFMKAVRKDVDDLLQFNGSRLEQGEVQEADEEEKEEEEEVEHHPASVGSSSKSGLSSSADSADDSPGGTG